MQARRPRSGRGLRNYSITSILNSVQTKVTMNERGVITIPAALRKELGLAANDELFVERSPEGILLRPAISVPIELYSEERIAEFARDEEAIGQHLPRS